MINTTQFDMQTDVLYQAQNSGYKTDPTDFGSLKRMNPSYIDKWYKLFTRYNGAELEPITTGFRVLDCYSTAKENLNTGLRSENITVALQLAPVAGKVADNSYIQIRLFGPGIELSQPYSMKKPASASFISFCQLMTAKIKTPFDRFLNLTVSNKTGWKEQRTHYPDIIAQTGIVSFIPTGLYGDWYSYTAFFFEPSATPGALPLSSNEFIKGKAKEPQCDFISMQDILQEAFNVFAGIEKDKEQQQAAPSAQQPPMVAPEHSGALPQAPAAPAGVGAAPAFGSATAQDDDEIPF